MHGGKFTNSVFFDRNHGVNVQWDATERMFQIHFNKLGFIKRKPEIKPKAIKQDNQLALFDL